MHLIRGGGFGRSAINEGVGVVLITCSARPMKIGGDPKEEWLLPEVKSSHTFLCMILLLPKLLRYRSFILNLFGSSDQLVVFYYFSSRKSFLRSSFLSILKFYLFFSSKIWIQMLSVHLIIFSLECWKFRGSNELSY